MTQTVAFWIVLGVAGFALVLAVQMRMMIAKVLQISVQAQHGDLHHNDIRAVVRAAPLVEAPEGFPDNLNKVRDWVRQQHPSAVGHLVKARRWSVILPVVIVVLLLIGRLGLGVI